MLRAHPTRLKAGLHFQSIADLGFVVLQHETRVPGLDAGRNLQAIAGLELRLCCTMRPGWPALTLGSFQALASLHFVVLQLETGLAGLDAGSDLQSAGTCVLL